MRNKSGLYIDESGKSSLIETRDPFILTGIIIDDVEVRSIEGFFTYIKRRYNIDEDTHFHSYEIFESPETKLEDRLLVELANTLANFISLIPLRVRVLKVDKQAFRNALGVKSDEDFKGEKERKEMVQYPYRVMASDLFAWFAEYLDKNDHIGQVIADSRRGGDHQLLKSLNGAKEGHVPYRNKIMSKVINERVTAICFAEKNFLSGTIELTDLISYITFFKVRRLISANEHIGVHKLWESIRSIDNFDLVEIDEYTVRRFFGLKEDEVHKYLRGNAS